jgi:growth factor-regulated tyrosine kinase substrate
MTDTLLDLHAKLATVVRYYDRMLEERLSSTYSQHSIGAWSDPSCLSIIIKYLSYHPQDIQSSQGGAESFYTGNAVAPSDPCSA